MVVPEEEWRRLHARLDAIEARLTRVEGAIPPRPATTTRLPESVPVEAFAVDRSKTRPAVARPRPARARAADLEATFGANWLAKAGVAVLVLGVSFFFKYAFDQGWVGLAARIWLGVVGGLLMAAAGDVLLWRKKWGRTYPQVVTAGGAAITYFSLYAAYAFEPYRAATGMPREIDAILLGLTALALAAYALARDAPTLAGVALGLGATTAMIRSDWPEFSVAYTVILVAAVLAAAARRGWSPVAAGALVASYGPLAFDLASEVDPFVVGGGAALLLLLFTAASLRSWPAERFPTGLLLPAGSLLGGWGLLLAAFDVANHVEWQGPLTAALAAAAAALALPRLPNTDARASWGAAAVVLTLAWPPLQFNDEAIVLAWTGLLAVTAASARRHRSQVLDAALVLLAGFILAHLAVVETERLADGVVDALLAGATYGAATVVLALAWALTARPGPNAWIGRVQLGGAFVVPVLYLGAALEGTFITMAWAAEGVAAVVAGFALRQRDVRLGAFGIFALVLLRIFMVDLSELEPIYRVVTFVVVGALFLGASFLYARLRNAP